MLTHRFDDALVFASSLHRTQTRKASKVPYVSHLLAVAALVLEYGGDEDQAIAALLHDAIEDQGGAETGELIRARFGGRVAKIVRECSDSDGQMTGDWQARKDAYIAGIASKSKDALLVTTCDKLHNAMTILADLQTEGEIIFQRFTAGREGTLWYYRAIANTLEKRMGSPLSKRLRKVVANIEDEAGGAVHLRPVG